MVQPRYPTLKPPHLPIPNQDELPQSNPSRIRTDRVIRSSQALHYYDSQLSVSHGARSKAINVTVLPHVTPEVPRGHISVTFFLVYRSQRQHQPIRTLFSDERWLPRNAMFIVMGAEFGHLIWRVGLESYACLEVAVRRGDIRLAITESFLQCGNSS